jgi:hypothetical protein
MPGCLPDTHVMGGLWHTDTATTRRYIHLNLERLRQIQKRAAQG